VLILAAVALMGNLLWLGRTDSLDTAIYRCYAHAFWDGPRMLHAADTRVCVALWSEPPRQFHTFPHEYPALALAVFSLPLLLPGVPYTAGFMAWMGAIMLGTTGWLIRRGQVEAAAALVLYSLLAGWVFTLQRFDLLAGLSVLSALVLAQRGRLRTAAALLALATLLKLFPVVLLPFLLIAGRRGEAGRWRWDVVAVFLAVCGIGVLPELLLNPSALWSPIHYELARPLQIESLPGSLIWAGSGMPAGPVIGGDGPRVVFSYYSLSVVGGAQLFWGMLAAAIGVVGMVMAYGRAWTRRDTLGRSFELAILVLMVSGKVLSPQYILWILPVVAVVEGIRVRWLLLCGLVCLITYFYRIEPAGLQFDRSFMATVLARNGLLCGLMAVYAFGAGDSGKGGASGCGRMVGTDRLRPGVRDVLKHR